MKRKSARHVRIITKRLTNEQLEGDDLPFLMLFSKFRKVMNSIEQQKVFYKKEILAEFNVFNDLVGIWPHTFKKRARNVK